MSRFTQVLTPDQVRFFRDPDTTGNADETIIDNTNENEYEDKDEDVNVGIKVEKEDEEVEEEETDEEEDIVDKEEDFFGEEEDVEDKPGPRETKLKHMSHEEINELISNLQLKESEGGEEYDSFEEDDPKVKKIQEKKNKAKQAPPKQEKKPTTNANKQGKKELITEKSSKHIEESKSKKNRNKTTVPTKEENITDDISHPPNSVDHNAETKQKKGRNKKQHLKEEAMKSDFPTEKEKLPSKRTRGKKQVSDEAHENNSLAVPSKYDSHANEDSKSRKTRKGKVEQSQKEEDSSEGTTKQNKAEEAASTNSKDNSKENRAKVKSDKGKSKAVDNSGVKGAEPKVTENKREKAGKSVTGKQTNTASDFKINKEDGVKKGDTEIKEDIRPINERPKRNITRKDYAHLKDVATASKVKKETEVKQPLQSHSREAQIGNMIDSAPINNEKTKTQRKGKKNTEVKENSAINEVEKVKKTVARKK